MKAIIAILISVITGALLGFAWTVVSAFLGAVILGFILDPFLALIDVPFLTERLSGLGFGQLFVLVLAIRLLIGIFIPAKPDTKSGAGG
ncbi:MAG: hypothetical protein LBK83_07750 [Treponema sp.]|jgi:hypothetical protein|nr:hypothetical protein [Treponema sp.]